MNFLIFTDMDVILCSHYLLRQPLSNCSYFGRFTQIDMDVPCQQRPEYRVNPGTAQYRGLRPFAPRIGRPATAELLWSDFNSLLIIRMVS